MSLSDLAALGSFVSGAAVLVSLIFLYFQLRQISEQVRQSDKNQRAMINESFVSRNADILRVVSEPENARLMARINAGETEFTAAELWRLSMAFRLVLINAQATLQQYEAGLLDSRSYDTTMAVLREVYLARAPFRAMWLQWTALSSPQFVAAVEDLIREVPLKPPNDTVANYHSALAQVIAGATAN